MDIHKIAHEFHEVLRFSSLPMLTGFIALIKTSKKEKELSDLEKFGDNFPYTMISNSSFQKPTRSL